MSPRMHGSYSSGVLAKDLVKLPNPQMLMDLGEGKAKFIYDANNELVYFHFRGAMYCFKVENEYDSLTQQALSEVVDMFKEDILEDLEKDES